MAGQVDFTYGQSHPCPVDGTHIRPPYDCFIAKDGSSWVWWQKWKVMQMQTSDAFSGNALSYTYSTPTWHHWEDTGCSSCADHVWNDFRGQV